MKSSSSESDNNEEGSQPIGNKRQPDSWKRSTRNRVQRAWKLLRLRRRWEKEMHKNRALPAPFAPIRVRDKNESMQANLLLICAIMECVCGFVFPICDAVALTDKWTQFGLNHKYYMETFLVSQYIGAILALAYLQSLVYYYGTPSDPGHRDTRNDTLRDLHTDNVSSFKFEHTHHEEEESRTFATSGSVVPGQYEEQTGKCLRVCCPKRSHEAQKNNYITWHQEGMNLYMRLGAVGFGLGVMIHDGFKLSSAWELGEPLCHSYLWIPKHSLCLVWVLWQTYFLFKYHRVLIHVHAFSVRMAFTHLAVVNLCHWLKVVVGEISDTLKHGDWSLDADTTGALEDVLSNTLTSYGLRTLIVDTNETVVLPNSTYIDSRVSGLAAEIQRNFKLRAVTDATMGPVGVNCRAHLGQMLKPFLFPLVIEYSLITGTLFYKMLQRVGEYEFEFTNGTFAQGQHTSSMPSLINPSTPSLSGIVQSASSAGTPMDDTASSRVENCQHHMQYRPLLGCRVFLPVELDETSDPNGDNRTSARSATYTRSFVSEDENGTYCHRSHNGLFLGMMVFIATAIGIMFFLSMRKTNLLRYTPHIYHYTKIIMLSISLVACLLAIIQTYPMKFRRIKSSENFEYNLLGLGLLGCLTYHMLLFVPTLETTIHVSLYQLNTNATHTGEKLVDTLTTSKLDALKGTAELYIIKCTIEILQAALQFFFIVETSRRGPCCRNQAFIKPGRSAIVFLLITNLALWLINTFEVRQTENQLALHRQYYGRRTWSVITCCFIPLIIFFRFHSTVCLAQIWSALYKWK